MADNSEAYSAGELFALLDKLLVNIDYTLRMSIALAVICTICVALRIYVKLRMTKSFKGDDWSMIIAYLLFLVIVALGMRFGYIAREFLHGHTDVLGEASRIGLAGQVIYVADTIACKASVGLFLLPLFGLHGRWERCIICMFFVLTVLFGIVSIIFSLIIGSGSGQAYLSDDRTGLRYVSERFNLTWSIINMIADVAYAVLCVPVIWRSKFMPRRTKLVASVLLCFGSVGVVAGILRLVVYLGVGWTIIADGKLLLARYSIMECGLCIAAASLATTRPLFAKWFGAIRQLSSGSRSKTGASTTGGSMAGPGGVTAVPLSPYPESTAKSNGSLRSPSKFTKDPFAMTSVAVHEEDEDEEVEENKYRNRARVGIGHKHSEYDDPDWPIKPQVEVAQREIEAGSSHGHARGREERESIATLDRHQHHTLQTSPRTMMYDSSDEEERKLVGPPQGGGNFSIYR